MKNIATKKSKSKSKTGLVRGRPAAFGQRMAMIGGRILPDLKLQIDALNTLKGWTMADFLREASMFYLASEKAKVNPPPVVEEKENLVNINA